MTRSGSYAINIPANQNFYLQSLEGVQLDNYNAEPAKYPQYFIPHSNNGHTGYAISLPATLQLDGEYSGNKISTSVYKEMTKLLGNLQLAKNVRGASWFSLL